MANCLNQETPRPVDVHDTGIITWWVSRQLISDELLDATEVNWTVERTSAEEQIHNAALNEESIFRDLIHYMTVLPR